MKLEHILQSVDRERSVSTDWRTHGFLFIHIFKASLATKRKHDMSVKSLYADSSEKKSQYIEPSKGSVTRQETLRIDNVNESSKIIKYRRDQERKKVFLLADEFTRAGI